MLFSNMFDACRYAERKGCRDKAAENYLEYHIAEGDGMAPHAIRYYAHHVIRGRWFEHEDVVLTHPEATYMYALKVIKGRWPEAEDVIRSSRLDYWCHYKRSLKRGPAKDLWEKKWAWLRAEGVTENLFEILNELGLGNAEMQEYIVQRRPDLISKIRNLKPSIRRKYWYEDQLAGVDI